MTEVSFYTNVPDRLSYLCRLLRKAQQSGAKVGVLGPERLLSRLDAALWSQEPLEFIPHLMVNGQSADLLARTPILLVKHPDELPHREVLLNLDSRLPPAVEQFQRVLEVVSTDADQVQAGRERFKQYKAQGFTVSHHVVGAG
ncbi:DNA polymerase III subunit chi [Paucibacter sp. APW11]|uniref:DNA polymerase III subunit chi n=1 Tax=Roseateles aquae TaxID=3077235 RepID=A0ABU3P5W1_9BURK|nr:DNA polymerase III subunit chi [Paucibacter sp. APW11]MDT8997966.1 DNA polymerase III subunit chi [Paucibacter sp. APW11]